MSSTVEVKTPKPITSEELFLYEGFCNTINNMTRRYKSIPDPMLRHSLVLDKFLIFTDLMAGMMESKSENWNLPESLKIKMRCALENTRAELNSLSEWVISPIFSPSHPFGEKIMMTASRDFDANKDVK
jgi:hypothetical protein